MNNKKIKIFTNIGAILEYYDYVIFAYMVPILLLLFFPETGNEFFKNLQAILLSSVGNFSRIFGTFILGILSIRYGKSFVMLLSIYLMAISTVSIGLLPTYIQAGLISPLLLLFFRFLQGIAYSVELPTASIFIFDYSKENKGQVTGFLLASTTLGCVLAVFVMYLLSTYFSNIEISKYLWRIPFLIGGLVGILGIYIRKSLPINYRYEKSSIIEVLQFFKIHRARVLKSFSIILLPSLMIVIYIYMTQFFTPYFDYSKTQIYLASTMGLVFSVFVAVFTGVLIDKNVKVHIIYYGFLIFYPIIWLGLYSQKFLSLVLFCLIFQFFTTSFMVIALHKINFLIKSSGKSTLVIIIYNLAFISSYLIPSIFKHYNSINLLIFVPCLLAFFLILYNKYTRFI